MELLFDQVFINIVFKNHFIAHLESSHYYKMVVSLGGVKYVLCQIQSPPALHENTGGDV